MRRDIDIPARAAVDGKFLRAGPERFWVKGVTYGTFAPDDRGFQFPASARVAEDFRQMARLGINSVRIYTAPRPDLLDEAARNGLRVMVGLPWPQHVAFLDDRRLTRTIRRDLAAHVRELASHPAVLLFALGNEIPPGVVRWHGRHRIERMLEGLYSEAKAQAPESLFAYVNFPPTEYLDVSCFDVCAFNVYLHREAELRAYLARLQNVAGNKPLLLAEAGADSRREGAYGQARITAMHARAALEEGSCGAFAFAWTDEWWRGGEPVDDWAFGLVDRERRPKPAAEAVAAAFSEGPFPPAARKSLPRVSVVVCAYNAADTLEDCLASLERVDYPDFEVLLVDDGSRDRTQQLARGHPRVRIIESLHLGLSAARNAGLAAATGEVVAYVDADVRVDRDWLTWLVQPLLGSEAVVGSGGPNVVPPDDPPMAQAVARSPGGPTHVLLDDRVAEHVPGCNMAFRRSALLEVGGFNPVFRNAGDDVDICWRLQARGWQIAFAPAALVWHHHRSSVLAYWRQQVGYGEAEAWLTTQHPDRYRDGRTLWLGTIYSPLPHLRSLWRTHVNSGVWGTAAFPSVYRASAHSLAALPHSVAWQALSLVLLVAGAVAGVLGAPAWTPVILALVGLGGVAATVGKNARYALRSDLGRLSGSRLWYRLAIAGLHLVQPIARAWGRLRGTLMPPVVVEPRHAAAPERRPGPTLRDVGRAALLLTGSMVEDRFWSEQWTSPDRVLSRLTQALRRADAGRPLALDDGWTHQRDLSVRVGQWAWLDMKALVEEHERGRCLLRVGTSLRPTALGVAAVVASGAVLTGALAAGLAYRWPVASSLAALTSLALGLLAASRTARAATVARRSTEGVAASDGMMALSPVSAAVPARSRLAAPPRMRVYGLRTAAALGVTVLWLGAGAALLREAATAEVTPTPGRGGPPMSVWLEAPAGIAVDAAGDLYVADPRGATVRRVNRGSLAVTPFAGDGELGAGFSGDGGQALAARLHEPKGVAVAPDGDVLIADSHNHRIRRVDRETGIITTVAGSGAPTYDGDDKAAVEAALDQPSAVATAANGDIYIADTMNNRIRMIDHATGLIHTVAGTGGVAEEGPVGDGGPATDALLYMPSDVAVAPNGDLYIADMHHNRVRRVDAATGRITTVAGDGSFGNAPDSVPATRASLAGPSGIALMPGEGGSPILFIADSYNALVRRVQPNGVMRVVHRSGSLFSVPSRLAYSAADGWLYVADSMDGRLIALAIPNRTGGAPLIVPGDAPAESREAGR